MDIARKKNNNKFFATAVTSVVLSLFFIINNFLSSNTIDIDHIDHIDTVEVGELNIQADAYGTLISQDQKLLNAQSKATIEEILLKPGDVVQRDSVILVLSAPELEREYQQAVNALDVEIANKRYLLLEQKRELLSNTLELKKLKSRYEAASFNSKEIAELAAKGILSKLNHLEMIAQEKELEESVALTEESLNQLKELHKEGIAIQEATILRAQNHLDSLQEKVSQLTVRANMDGIVQSLFVELGQSVDVGMKLVTVADNNQLVAIVKVAQSQADMLKIGLEASINIAGKKTKGRVARIDPSVLEGTVSTEVVFDEPVPIGARPSLSVNGEISIQTLSDVLYIKRRVGARPNSVAKVIVNPTQDDERQVREVVYGLANQHFIQIKEGVSAGAQIMVVETVE